jgi:hypothetical protein
LNVHHLLRIESYINKQHIYYIAEILLPRKSTHFALSIAMAN